MFRKPKIIRVLLIVGLGCAAAAIYWSKTRQITAATRHLATEMEAIRSAPGRMEKIDLLRAENDRVKNDLRQMRQLEVESGELRKEILKLKTAAAQPVQSVSAQALAAEEFRKKQEIASIWEKNRRISAEADYLRKRNAAEKRLQRKVRIGNEDPQQVEAEYARLAKFFEEYAGGMRSQVELSKWVSNSVPYQEIPEAVKDASRAGSQVARVMLNSLGPDRVLYEEVPFRPLDDPATVPVLRSVLPDHRGISVTVFLDGTVRFTNQAQP